MVTRYLFQYHNYLVAFVLFTSLPAVAVERDIVKQEALDQDRLWLPVRYQGLFLDLKAAASAALDLQRCIEVMSGTLDMDNSTEDHPIFRIKCKQVNGRSYNELVDGLTKRTITAAAVDAPLTQEEQEALRLEEERRLQEAEEKRVATERAFWAGCEEKAREKAALMNQAQLYIEPRPEPIFFDELMARYQFFADAVNAEGIALYFTFHCEVDEQGARLSLKRRAANGDSGSAD